MKVIPIWKKTADWLIAAVMSVLSLRGRARFSFARAATRARRRVREPGTPTSEDGITQEIQGRHYAQAEAQARKLTALQPGNENAWLLLGVAEMQLKHIESARSPLNR